MKRAILIPSLVSLALVGACGTSDLGNDNQTNLNHNSNSNSEPVTVGSWEYLPESVVVDDATTYLEIVGIYAPSEAGESYCLLPVSEVRHRVWLPRPDISGIGSFVHITSVVPITRAEYAERAAAIPLIGQREFVVDPVGVVTVAVVKDAPLWEGQGVGGPAGFRFDGIQQGALSFGNCGPHVCGDALCGGGETVESCPLDCGCANGVLDAGEECDVGDFGGATCEDYGLTGEGLVCDLRDCRIYTTNCGPRPDE